MVKQLRSLIAVFAFILFAVSLVSAQSLAVYPGSIVTNIQQGNSQSVSFKLGNLNDTLDISNISFVWTTNPFGLIVPSYASNITNNTNSSDIPLNLNIPLSASLGNQTSTLRISYFLNDTPLSQSLNVYINVTQSPILSICGSKYTTGNISIGEIEDEEAGNEDAWDWRPLDNIELTINNVENNVDKDVKFDVSLIFYKDGAVVSGSKIADDKDDLRVDNFKINDNDDDDIPFVFRIDGKADEGRYELYVKVEGSSGCFVKKLDDIVEISKENRNVIAKEVDGPISTSCGSQVQLITTIANIGANDEDRVKVTLYNRDLGINLYKEIDNVGEGDLAEVIFLFNIPSTAQEKLYRLVLSTEFDYDDRDESYDEESDSDDDLIYTLNVLGGCVDTTKPTLSARLNSTATVGEELVVEISLKNNADTAISAIISADEYASWAEFIRVEPSIVSAAKQETKKAYITFKPTQAGQHTFNINVIYNGKTIDQAVTVNVADETSWLSGAYEQFGKTGTFLLLGIAVLVILIILVLVIRAIVSRKD